MTLACGVSSTVPISESGGTAGWRDPLSTRGGMAGNCSQRVCEMGVGFCMLFFSRSLRRGVRGFPSWTSAAWRGVVPTSLSNMTRSTRSPGAGCPSTRCGRKGWRSTCRANVDDAGRRDEGRVCACVVVQAVAVRRLPAVAFLRSGLCFSPADSTQLRQPAPARQRQRFVV